MRFILDIHALLTLCTLVIAVAGCELLGGDAEGDTAEQRLIGEWEWLSSSGGFAGHTITPDSAGQSPRRLTFDGRRAALYRADTLVWHVRYSLEREDGYWYLSDDAVDDRGFWIRKRVLFPSPDTLGLVDDCIDCYYHTYARIK